MSGQIFISYRRDDSSGWAGRLYDHISNHFPNRQIFMDVDNLDPGVDFVEAIETSVSSCEVLVAVIGKRWLVSSDDEGNRRLDKPDDFVRLEIATALKRNIRVIPVLVDGASMPRSTGLPEDLKPLVRRNALPVSHDRFRFDSERLTDAIKRLFEKVEAEQRQQQEKARLAAEQQEKERLTAEQQEKARLAAEQQEKARLAAEQQEKAQLAAEQQEKERLAAEQQEKERLAAEQQEKERLAAEQQEKERLAAEQRQRESERLKNERREKYRLEAERLVLESERWVAEQREKDGLETERPQREEKVEPEVPEEIKWQFLRQREPKVPEEIKWQFLRRQREEQERLEAEARQKEDRERLGR